MSKLIVGVNDLATVNPELAKEWDYEKNAPLTPKDVAGGTHKKVWWKCSNEHEWQASIANRSRGNKCPYCSNQKVLEGYNDLTTTNPELLVEWNYNRNTLKPNEVIGGSGKKVWWRCIVCNYEWETRIEHRVKGHGCPNCKRLKAKNTVYAIKGVNDLATLRPNLALEWNFEKNTIFPYEVTLGSEKNVWWKCRSGHEWQSIVSNRVKGSDCPYCSGRKAIVRVNDLATVNPKLAEEWNYEKNKGLVDGDGNDISLPTLILARSNQKVWWKCKNGHEWQASIANRASGNDCPYCANKKLLVGFNDLATKYPKLVSDWNLIKNENTPQDYITGSNKKVWWKCKNGHEWQAIIASRIRGNGCPYCAGQLPIVGETDLETTNPELAKEWNYEKNEKTPQDYTSGSGVKVWWVCENKHEWQAVICSRKNGTGCPYCSGSKTERLVYSYLKEIHIPFIAEKKFEQDIRVKWFPFDVWISSKRLIIEPDGEQHFSNKKGYFEQDVPFEKRRQNDNIKNQFCLEQKIPILRIPYTYNPDTEKEKIKSMIKFYRNEKDTTRNNRFL